MKTRFIPLFMLSASMLLAACGAPQKNSGSSVASSEPGTSSVTPTSSPAESSEPAKESSEPVKESSVEESSLEEEKGEKINTIIVSVDEELSEDETAKFTLKIFVGEKEVTKAEAGANVTVKLTIAEGATFRVNKFAVKTIGETPATVETAPGTQANVWNFVMPAEGEVKATLSLEKIPDVEFDGTKMVQKETGGEFSDGFFTSSYHKDSKVDGTSFKVGGNSEITSSKNKKTITFTAAKAGKIRLKWKAGSKEATRAGYLIQAAEDGSIGRYLGLAVFKLDDAGNAAWRTDTYVLPSAGKYYIAFNAAASVNIINIYYNETLGEKDVAPIAENMKSADDFNALYAIPSSDKGFAADKTIGNYTFSKGVVGKSYGKIEYTDAAGVKTPHYSVYEVGAGKTMKFNATGAGTMSMLISARAAKGEDGTAPTSDFVVTNAEGAEIEGTNLKALESSEVKKKIYAASVAFDAAGVYTFTASEKVDVYVASFAVLDL